MPTTLPGDVEEEQGTAPAEPLSPGEQAELDQIETGLREGDTAQEPKQPGFGAGAKAGFKFRGTSFKKPGTKKKIFIIGGGLGAAAGIGAILFFLLLFKNIHIKNLFLDYEFSKFNRAFRNRLEKSINDPEAKPAGSAESTVSPTDSPEVALSEANAVELEKIKADPSAAKEAIKDTLVLDESAAGTGSIVDDALGVEKGISEPKGQADEEVKKSTDTAVEEEINKGLESGKSPPNDAVREAVDDTNKVAETATTTIELQESAVKGFSRGLNSITSKLTGPLVVATIACIARDIFSTPGHVITKIRFQGLARSAATLNKYADCQKQGKCSLSQVADIAQKFDNSSGSFTQSCAYLRAAGKVGSDCAELDSSYQVIPTASSIPDQLVRLSDTLDGHISIGPVSINLPIATACGLILKPGFQGAFAALNIGGSALAAATGVADFGASDVAVAAAQGASIVFASKVGKALALDAALYYGGGPFKRNFSAPDWGNLVGGGDKALSTAAAAVNGARQLTPEENTELALAIHADQVKEASQQSIAYRLFSPHNPTSTMGLIADRMPSSPQTAVASISTFIATAFNPQHLGRSILSFINPIRPAWAADTTSNTYGIPDYGFTDAELNQWGVVENSRWVKQFVASDKQAEFDKCFDPKQTPIVDLLTSDGNGAKCNGYNSADNPDHTAFLHYRIYKLDQRVTQDLVLLYNNQGGSGGSVQTTSGAAGAPIVVSGDASQLAQQLLDNPRVLKVGRLVQQDLQDTADGKPASGGSSMSTALLKAIASVAATHSIRITALESGGTGHATHSRHYTGDGVDIDQIDGQAVTGRNAPAITLINALLPVLPPSSRLGQSGCGPTPPLPNGITTFEDSCNHLHIDVPVGTP